MIRVRNLSMKFDERILFKNLNFTLKKGINFINGENGSGKSTLIKLLMGILKPTEGSVTYSSNKISFSYAGQEESIFSNLSLNKNIKILKASIDKERFNKLCKLLRFHDKDKKISYLSGGERQKAELIFSLSKDATVYFLDEPFSSIDKESKENLIDFLNEFSSNNYIVLINHDKTINSLNITQTIELTSKNKEEKDFTYKEIRKKNNIGLAITSYFKNNSLFSFIKSILLIGSFILFALGMSYVNTKSNAARYESLLLQDPFNVHSVNLINIKSTDEIDSSFFDAKEGNHQYLKLFENKSQKAITFYGTSEDSQNLYYYTNNKTNAFADGQEVHVKNLTYRIKVINKEKLSSLLPNKSKHIQSILDDYKKDELLLCSNKLIDNILTNNNDKIRGSNNISFNSSYGFSFQKNEGYLTSYFASLKSNVIEERNDYYLSIPQVEKGTVIKNYESKIEITVNSSSEDSKIHISLPLLKLLYTQYNSFNRDEVVFGIDMIDSNIVSSIKEFSSIIIPQEIYQDYSKLSNSSIYLYFPLSAILFLCDLFLIFFTRNKYSKWYLSEINVFSRNDINTKSLDLGLLISNAIEASLSFVISLILYITTFIKNANFNLMKNNIINHPSSYYYYSEQPNNPYYDNITSPMKLISFEPLFFMIILLCFIYVLSNFLACKSSKKR